MSTGKKAEKILRATIRLFIRDGIKRITMDDIADYAHVSKVTIYKYFTDKDNLYREVGKYIHSHYIVRLESIVASGEILIERLCACLDVVSDFANSGQYDLCRELAGYSTDIEAEHELYLQTYRRTLLTLINEGMQGGLLRSDLDRDMIFHYIDMGVVYYQQNPEYRNRMLNDMEFRRQYMQFFISSIFVDGTRMLSNV